MQDLPAMEVIIKKRFMCGQREGTLNPTLPHNLQEFIGYLPSEI
jgi:hypothetical protein